MCTDTFDSHSRTSSRPRVLSTASPLGALDAKNNSTSRNTRARMREATVSVDDARLLRPPWAAPEGIAGVLDIAPG
eukprot:scaffold22738_cov31-Tisochrysis_lutea.AAC.5